MNGVHFVQSSVFVVAFFRSAVLCVRWYKRFSGVTNPEKFHQRYDYNGFGYSLLLDL
jgi:hypothetical protein